MKTLPKKNDVEYGTYRVWIDQVNQTYVDVVAQNKGEAIEKGYLKWRSEHAHSRVSYIEKQEDEGN